MGDRQWLRHFPIRYSACLSLGEQGLRYWEPVPPAPTFVPEVCDRSSTGGSEIGHH